MEDPDKKKMEDKPNKAFYPASNKQVRIKMRPGRAAEGVTVDEKGYATVDAQVAEYLIAIQYAELAEE
jgi:hypothetical protein